MQILLILALSLALVTVTFAVQNAMPVTVGFPFRHMVNAPLAEVGHPLASPALKSPPVGGGSALRAQ